MAESTADLTVRLSRGPAFLFLGQDHLASPGRRDPFLTEIQRKYRQSESALQGYQALLDVVNAAAVDSALAWMDERCRHLAIPEATEVLAKFPWSGVVTSAIDSIVLRGLRNQWREVQPLFEPEQQPRDPRNRFRLNVTFLFGCVNQTEPARRPPLTAMELRKRRQVALMLARRIPELLTPFGVLLIEGYRHDSDWLPFAELAPILDDLQPGQAFLFGASRPFLDDADARTLIDSGRLTVADETLATFLLESHRSGRLRLEAPESRDDTGKRIYMGEELVGVPRDLWHQVARSAVVLDTHVLDQPSPLSDDALYQEFREAAAALASATGSAGTRFGSGIGSSSGVAARPTLTGECAGCPAPCQQKSAMNTYYCLLFGRTRRQNSRTDREIVSILHDSWVDWLCSSSLRSLGEAPLERSLGLMLERGAQNAALPRP